MQVRQHGVVAARIIGKAVQQQDGTGIARAAVFAGDIEYRRGDGEGAHRAGAWNSSNKHVLLDLDELFDWCLPIANLARMWAVYRTNALTGPRQNPHTT
jgi:hypothetical protein